MRIIIPVNAGYLYRVGIITVDGVKAITSQYIKAVVTLKPGEIYSTKMREK